MYHLLKQTIIIISVILKVDLQFLIMTFLSPADICRFGATSRYWRAMVRDPVLWKYFLLRDMPYWPSIDHVTMPHLELLDAPLINENETLDDREEGEDKWMKSKLDYMSEWVSSSAVTHQGQLIKCCKTKMLLTTAFVSTGT